MKNVRLSISPNSQENTCVEVSFLIKLLAGGLKRYKFRIEKERNTQFAHYILNVFYSKYFISSASKKQVNVIFRDVEWTFLK